MIHARPLQSHEWPLYRDLRLHALRDSPDAFGSTLEAEAGHSDAAWQSRIAAALACGKDHVLLAVDGDRACGLLWCKLPVAEPGMADLYQMWLAPGSRGRGAGRALLEAALDWARAAGARRARLGVTVADSPAMRLYRAAGFCAVGDPQPLREGSPLLSQAMERALEDR